MSDVLSGLLGVQQGRLTPVGFEPVDGSHAFVLGYDALGSLERITPGDEARISQAAADLTGERLLYLRGLASLPTLPPGLFWRVMFTVAGVDESIDLVSTQFFTSSQFALVDLAANISGVNVGDIEIRISLVGPGDVQLIQLPGFYFDEVASVDPVGDIELINRIPHPGQTDVPVGLAAFVVTIAPLDGGGNDLSTISVVVQGAQAITLGVFEAGFAGSITDGTGPSSVDTKILILVDTLTFASQELVDVDVDAETLGGEVLSVTYQFQIQDITAPQLLEAFPLSKTTIRLTYSEAVKQATPSSSDDALNPSLYTITRDSSPAVALEVSSVDPGDTADVVILNTNTEHSFGALYTITVVGVVDEVGNQITPPDNTVSFSGFTPTIPEARSFMLWKMIGGIHRTSDQGDLRKLLDVLQDPLDLILCLIDQWSDILDADLANELFIEAMLTGLGNPFSFDLDISDQRRLISVLVAIYQAKGTNVGAVDAIFFFLGIEVEIMPLNNSEGSWILDLSELGIDTLLFTDDSFTLYSFNVISPIILSDEERTAILFIINYMKPAHEHLLALIEPIPPDPDLFWILGEGELGEDSELQLSL